MSCPPKWDLIVALKLRYSTWLLEHPISCQRTEPISLANRISPIDSVLAGLERRSDYRVTGTLIGNSLNCQRDLFSGLGRVLQIRHRLDFVSRFRAYVPTGPHCCPSFGLPAVSCLQRVLGLAVSGLRPLSRYCNFSTLSHLEAFCKSRFGSTAIFPNLPASHPWGPSRFIGSCFQPPLGGGLRFADFFRLADPLGGMQPLVR